MNKIIFNKSIVDATVVFVLSLAVGLFVGMQSARHLVQHYFWELFVNNNQQSQTDYSFVPFDSVKTTSAFVPSQDGCGCPSCCSTENI